MESKSKKSNLDFKLNSLFYELRTSLEFSLEDDTVMEKLCSSLQLHFEKKEDGLAWCKRVGLLELIEGSLNEEIVNNDKFSSVVSLSLKLLSFLVTKERNFIFLLQEKVMCNFLKMIPILKTKMSFCGHSLKVVESLLSHSGGSEWTYKNGLWRSLMVSSLDSQNIFVQKQCIQTSSKFLLKATSSVFKNCILDLELLRSKFQELISSLKNTQEENLERRDQKYLKLSCYATSYKIILLIYLELLIMTLGKYPMCTKLRPALDSLSKLILSLKQDENSEVIRLSLKILLLGAFHKYQENLFELGTAEQYHLDLMTSDLLTLAKQMINTGRYPDLLIISYSVVKYWAILCKNLKERNLDVELSKGDSIGHIMLRIQLFPVNSLLSSSDSLSSPGESMIMEKDFLQLVRKINQEAYEQMDIRKEHKDIVKQLENKVIKHYNDASHQDLERIMLLCFTEGHAHAEHLSFNTGMVTFEFIIYFLHYHCKASNLMHCNPRLVQLAIDGLSILIDKFSIDWKKCFISIYTLELLTGIIWIPQITAQVKVSTLKAMTSCVKNFIPPAMSALVNIDKQKDSSLLQAGKILPVFLSDSDWEVRDSALEFISVCMQLARNEYPFFVDWILNLNLIDGILLAIGDSESYVQASTLQVIGNFVHLQKIWEVIEGKGIKHYAFRSIVKSGDPLIRVAGIHLLKSLYSASRFSNAEIDDFVMPVIQKLASDCDDEIQFMALDFINYHLENELINKGMVDGLFPRVTFYKGKITQLQETDIKALVLDVVTWFCKNGYCYSVLGCLFDPIEKISEKAQNILKLVSNLVSNHNIMHDFEYRSRSHKGEREPSFTLSEGDQDDVMTELNSQPTDEDKITRKIEEVLQTTDLEVLSKLPETQYTPASPLWWWNGDVTLPPLSPQDVPPKLAPVSSTQLFRALDKLSSEKEDLEEIKSDETEKALLFLLDDIFLEAGPINDCDDQRARDCY